jgi:hypothetical protein
MISFFVAGGYFQYLQGGVEILHINEMLSYLPVILSQVKEMTEAAVR